MVPDSAHGHELCVKWRSVTSTGQFSTEKPLRLTFLASFVYDIDSCHTITGREIHTSYSWNGNWVEVCSTICTMPTVFFFFFFFSLLPGHHWLR